MKKILIFAFIAIPSLIGCQKELIDTRNQDNVIPVIQNFHDSCRIATAYYYGGSGGINDSANFYYTGNKLMSVIGSSADVYYTYVGNQLFSMAYYEKPGNLLYHIDTFHYLNDGILLQIVSHDYDMYNHNDTVHSKIDFIYNGNLLSRLVTIDWYESVPDIDTLTSDFRWQNNNVKSIFLKSSQWEDDSIYYSYDTNPNYFNATSKYFLLADPFFQLHVGFDPHLPYFISKNNVIKYTIYTNIDYPVTYQIDSMYHPILVSQGGFDYMGYKWECP